MKLPSSLTPKRLAYVIILLCSAFFGQDFLSNVSIAMQSMLVSVTPS